MSTPTDSPKPATARLPFLDALRGVAILLVVLVHVGGELGYYYGLRSPRPVLLLTEYGQMGVQLFFVVSAFSLCVAQERRGADAHGLRTFFIQRFFRIAPLYYVGIVVSLLLGILQAHDSGAAQLVPGAYTAKGIVSNVLFVHGFVASANNNVVRGGWSIGVEMAFYAIFPLAFWLAGRAAREGGRALALLWAGFFVVTLVIFHRLTDGFLIAVVNSKFLYFSLANQLPVFVAGLAAYFARTRGLWRPGLPLCAAMVVGLTAAAIALAQARLPYSYVLIPSLSGLSFVFLLEIFAQVPRLAPAWLQWIGRISYSMYIFHFTVVYLLCRHVFGAVMLDWPLPRLALALGVTVGITAVIAAASERWIERPGIALGRRLIRRLAAGGKVP